MKTTLTHKTLSAYLSGSICGKMWWPAGAMASLPIWENLRAKFDRFTEPASFRDALNSILMEKGGDFSNSLFSSDTVVRIERRQVTATGYTVHVWERSIADLPDCADLVNPEFNSADSIFADND